MPDMPIFDPNNGGEGIAIRDDSRDDPLRWKRRADPRLAVTAVQGHIDEQKRRGRGDGMIDSLLVTQGVVKCLDAAVELVRRDVTHDDPRTRIQAAKLAVKVLELVEVFTREPQVRSRGEKYKVLRVGGQPIPADDHRRAAFRRLREITGG